MMNVVQINTRCVVKSAISLNRIHVYYNLPNLNPLKLGNGNLKKAEFLAFN